MAVYDTNSILNVPPPPVSTPPPTPQDALAQAVPNLPSPLHVVVNDVFSKGGTPDQAHTVLTSNGVHPDVATKVVNDVSTLQGAKSGMVAGAGSGLTAGAGVPRGVVPSMMQGANAGMVAGANVPRPVPTQAPTQSIAPQMTPPTPQAPSTPPAPMFGPIGNVPPGPTVQSGGPLQPFRPNFNVPPSAPSSVAQSAPRTRSNNFLSTLGSVAKVAIPAAVALAISRNNPYAGGALLRGYNTETGRREALATQQQEAQAKTDVEKATLAETAKYHGEEVDDNKARTQAMVDDTNARIKALEPGRTTKVDLDNLKLIQQQPDSQSAWAKYSELHPDEVLANPDKIKQFQNPDGTWLDHNPYVVPLTGDQKAKIDQAGQKLEDADLKAANTEYDKVTKAISLMTDPVQQARAINAYNNTPVGKSSYGKLHYYRSPGEQGAPATYYNPSAVQEANIAASNANTLLKGTENEHVKDVIAAMPQLERDRQANLGLRQKDLDIREERWSTDIRNPKSSQYHVPSPKANSSSSGSIYSPGNPYGKRYDSVVNQRDTASDHLKETSADLEKAATALKDWEDQSRKSSDTKEFDSTDPAFAKHLKAVRDAQDKVGKAQDNVTRLDKEIDLMNPKPAANGGPKGSPSQLRRSQAHANGLVGGANETRTININGRAVTLTRAQAAKLYRDSTGKSPSWAPR